MSAVDHGSGPEPLADASVRSARTEDVSAVGGLQARVWRDAYAGRIPAEVLAEFDGEAFAAVWARSLQSPPTGAYRLLVALTGETVTGFAAVAPSQDPDLGNVSGEVTTLGVDPDARGRGHGSRLLNACVDLLADAGAELVAIWLPADDERTRAFLHGAGFAPDGAFRDRVVTPEGGTLREVRLIALTPQASPGDPAPEQHP